MAWDGTGTFSRLYDWTTNRDAGVKILASEMDAEDEGFTAGINACLAKNGENAATGNLNLGGFRMTNAGNATARTDLLTAAQRQDGSVVYAAGSGTNTITATMVPAITAYANGQIFFIKFANTTTGNSTLNINSVGALNTYYTDGTTRLPGGECIQNNIGIFQYDSSLNASAGGFVLINPSAINTSYTGTMTGLTTSPTATITLRISADGSMCTLIPGTGMTGTSNATTCTITGGPAIMQPLQTQSFYMAVFDNGAAAAGTITLTASSGTVTLGKGTAFPSASGFTNSGTKAWANASASSAGAAISYCLR